MFTPKYIEDGRALAKAAQKNTQLSERCRCDLIRLEASPAEIARVARSDEKAFQRGVQEAEKNFSPL